MRFSPILGDTTASLRTQRPRRSILPSTRPGTFTERPKRAGPRTREPFYRLSPVTKGKKKGNLDGEDPIFLQRRKRWRVAFRAADWAAAQTEHFADSTALEC